MNDPFVHEQAEGFARRLLAAQPDEADRIRLAYRMAMAREPLDDELEEGKDLPGAVPATARGRRGPRRRARPAELVGLRPHAVREQRIRLRRLITGVAGDPWKRRTPRRSAHAAPDPPAGGRRLRLARPDRDARRTGRGRRPGPCAVRPPIPWRRSRPTSRRRRSRVIFLYMTGGVSHVDSFDPKPRLFAGAGKTVRVDNFQGKPGDFKLYLKSPQFAFRPGGACGTEVSDLFPHMRSIVDDLCVIRSMSSDHTNHYEGTLGMHTGSFTFARPSIGSWVSYGLGTENREPPLVRGGGPAVPYAGTQTWGSDFLPGCHQGTHIVPGPTPIANVRPPGRLRRAPAARARRWWPTPIAGTSSARRPTRRSRPASARSRRPTACSARRPRCSTSPASPTRRSRCTAWSAAGPTASPGNAWSAAGWPSAASGSSS